MGDTVCVYLPDIIKLIICRIMNTSSWKELRNCQKKNEEKNNNNIDSSNVKNGMSCGVCVLSPIANANDISDDDEKKTTTTTN